MSSEAQARVTINKLLEDAGWRFLPDADGRRENIICEHRIAKGAFSKTQDLGKDFENAPQGFVDYLLLNTDQRPAAVLEAKREGIDPLTAKEQARKYAEGLPYRARSRVRAQWESRARCRYHTNGNAMDYLPKTSKCAFPFWKRIGDLLLPPTSNLAQVPVSTTASGEQPAMGEGQKQGISTVFQLVSAGCFSGIAGHIRRWIDSSAGLGRTIGFQ